MTESDFPVSLLQQAQILHTLRFDSNGYLLVCKMTAGAWEDYDKKSLRGSRKVQVKVLAREKSSTVLLRVSGHWLERGEKLTRVQSTTFDFFRSLERSAFYSLENPVISARAINLSIVAEAGRIKQLLNGLEQFNIQYKVRKLGRLGTKTESTLSELTLQQSRVLKLAHTMGYYDIPRRTNTEDLAKMLGMEKATVGEHLRRAEKNVFDKIIVE